MSQLDIRPALEQHLVTLSPSLPLIGENDGQEVPEGPYMEVRLLPAEPDNQIQGSTMYKAHGILQVLLKYALGEGPGAADAKAQAIVDLFKRGTTVEFNGQKVIIDYTPKVSGGFTHGARWVVPVSIRYHAWVVS